MNRYEAIIEDMNRHTAITKGANRHEAPRIHYAQPYNLNKNIGKANNDFISLLPPDDWVCITDGDAMFLRPSWGVDVAEVVLQHGNDYGLIGCTTNRLGHVKQLYQNRWSEDMDMRNHAAIADRLWEQYGTSVRPIDNVAGVFMLFKVSTWRAVGGFKEGTHAADIYFSQDVRRKGLKIGLAQGIYMMHAYRLQQTDQKLALQDIKHLK